MPVAPPRPKGPPLTALRAFEAAARLGGFLAAAEELGVTPGAVSQQVKSLETWAGAPLFRRQAQGVVLTALGADVAQDFSAAFDALGEAARRMRTGADHKTIAIAALPSVAQLWLAPRMPALRKALPLTEFSVTALESRPNLRREMFDVSIFLDTATGSRNETVLAQDRLFPVCAPALANRLRSPADLAREIWINDASWGGDWASWIDQTSPGLPLKPGPAYSLYSLALAEAENGAGVLIGHTQLVATSIAQGRLVAPFGDGPASGMTLNLETATGVSGRVLKAITRVLQGNT